MTTIFDFYIFWTVFSRLIQVMLICERLGIAARAGLFTDLLFFVLQQQQRQTSEQHSFMISHVN